MVARVVVGIGNSVDGYKTTRHNAGHLVIDELAKFWHAAPFSRKKGCCFFSQCLIEENLVALIKNDSFINVAGLCMPWVMDRYKVLPEKCVVIHDDVELKNFSIRVKENGGAGGHNGIRSIDRSIGNGYLRIRIGIGKPARDDPNTDMSEYVLSKIDDMERFKQLTGKIAENFPCFLSGMHKEFIDLCSCMLG